MRSLGLFAVLWNEWQREVATLLTLADFDLIGSDDMLVFVITMLGEITEHGYDDYKRNTFEASAHIPLLIKSPFNRSTNQSTSQSVKRSGSKSGNKDSRPVSLIDLPVTILAEAGAEIPSAMAGRDLATLSIPEGDVNTAEDLAKQAVYMEISESYVGRAIVSERWKYVIYDPGAHPWDDRYGKIYQERYLFDMKNDPMEKNNLVHNSEFAEIKSELRKALILKAKDVAHEDIVIE